MPKDADISAEIAAIEAQPAEAAEADATTAATDADSAAEAPKEDTTEPAKAEAEEPRARQLAEILSREKRAREEKAAAKAEREQLAQVRADIEARQAELAELQQLARTDPDAYLRRTGVDFDVLAKSIIAKSKGEAPPHDERVVLSKIEQLEKTIAEERQYRAQAEARQARAQAETYFLGLAKAEGAYPHVVAYLDDHEIIANIEAICRQAQTEGIRLDDSEVLSTLESRLAAKHERITRALPQTKAAQSTQDRQEPGKNGRRESQPKTVSQEMQQAAVTPARAKPREERIQEVIATLAAGKTLT